MIKSTCFRAVSFAAVFGSLCLFSVSHGKSKVKNHWQNSKYTDLMSVESENQLYRCARGKTFWCLSTSCMLANGTICFDAESIDAYANELNSRENRKLKKDKTVKKGTLWNTRSIQKVNEKYLKKHYVDILASQKFKKFTMGKGGKRMDRYLLDPSKNQSGYVTKQSFDYRVRKDGKGRRSADKEVELQKLVNGFKGI